MRTLLAALTCLMLFATPVVAGDYRDMMGDDWQEGHAALAAGDN